MLRFSLFGIPVQVQPWFWLTMAILGGGDSANTRDALLRLVLFALAGFISIVVHELGHALTGRAFGARSAITLQAFGGYAEFSGAYFTRPQHFLVTAAGPFVQILLGVAIILVIPDLWHLKSDAGYFWSRLAWISIAWAVLNLLPVMPLDGGQMLNALLGPARLRITLTISIITALGTAWLIFAKTGSLLFPLFMGLFAFQAWKALREQR
jgi:membrane-associated protease RseP (regulator of RpoE activity)